MKRVLIIISAHISVHGRALKEILALKPEYEIDTIGTGSSLIDGVGYYQLKENRKLLNTEKIKMLFRIIGGDYQGYFKSLNLEERIEGKDNIVKPDLIIAHNADGLYIANALCKEKKWTTPIVLNMHEYLPKQSSSL